MKKEDIIALPHSCLRQKSQKVTSFGKPIKDLIKALSPINDKSDAKAIKERFYANMSNVGRAETQ